VCGNWQWHSGTAAVKLLHSNFVAMYRVFITTYLFLYDINSLHVLSDAIEKKKNRVGLATYRIAVCRFCRTQSVWYWAVNHIILNIILFCYVPNNISNYKL